MHCLLVLLLIVVTRDEPEGRDSLTREEKRMMDDDHRQTQTLSEARASRRRVVRAKTRQTKTCICEHMGRRATLCVVETLVTSSIGVKL